MTTAPEERGHVELRDVTVGRGERDLVWQLSLSIPRGSFVAVVGPSGAGKTSLLSCLAGLCQPHAGRITYRCEEQCEHTPGDFQKRLGLVFQHLRLTPNATVTTNVLCGALGQHSWWRTALGFPAADRRRAAELIERFELGVYARMPVSKISGGERQRTAIARALMQNPELVLADEPVSNLDARLAREVLGFLKRETRDHRRTVFCVLHDPILVDEFADYVLSLSKEDPGAWSLEKKAA